MLVLKMKTMSLILMSAAVLNACGNAPVVAQSDPLADCMALMNNVENREAATCFAAAAANPELTPRARYGELLARSAEMIAGTWAKLEKLIPGGAATLGAVGCTLRNDPQLSNAPSYLPAGVPLNLVVENLFAHGLSEALAVRDLAASLLTADTVYDYEFQVTLPFYLSDLSPIFTNKDEPLQLSGHFGRLELVHLQAAASALAAMIQLVQAHDLTISSISSLFKEPNFTTVLARETHFLSLRDPRSLAAAGKSLALLADALSRFQGEAERRFGQQGWLIRTVDLHANGRLDPRDVMIYTFLNVDLTASGFAPPDAGDGTMDTGWVTFPDSWPADFFDSLTTGATAIVRNLVSLGHPAVPLSSLAPMLAMVGINAGPLVQVVGLDFSALFAANLGIRDYLPYYRCTGDRCMPLESPEWVTDRSHFAGAITSNRPITRDDEQRWQDLLAANGYHEEDIHTVFTLDNAGIPADGIHYPVGETGPSNIYRLYREPDFAGLVRWDAERFYELIDPATADLIRARTSVYGNQFLTNAILGWYTVQTRQRSPFAAMAVVSGLRFSEQSAGEEFGCSLPTVRRDQTVRGPWLLQVIRRQQNRHRAIALDWLLLLGLPAMFLWRHRRPAHTA